MKGCFGVEVNLSMYERLLRVVVGALLISSVAFDRPFALSGWAVYAAAAGGAVLVATGITGNCPLYAFLDRMAEKGMESAEKKEKKRATRTSRAGKRSASRASRASAKRKASKSAKGPSRKRKK